MIHKNKKMILGLYSLFLSGIACDSISNLANAGKVSIVVEFEDESFTRSQKVIFQSAAKRWEKMVIGTNQLPDYTLTIHADAKYIDGPYNILGNSEPTHIFEGTNIPGRGIMSFDKDDLNIMEKSNILNNVITHEMGHVLGLGTMWELENLVKEFTAKNPVFIGKKAKKVYTKWKGSSIQLDVPVANTGGAGTYGSHWREDIFGNELMTGILNTGINPISELTLASFEDLKYSVDYSAAELYRLPTIAESKNFSIKNKYFKNTIFRTKNDIEVTEIGNF